MHTGQKQDEEVLECLSAEVLEIELDESINAVRSKKPRKIPVAMTPEEVNKLMSFIPEKSLLMSKVLYGCGLRIQDYLHFYCGAVAFVQI